MTKHILFATFLAALLAGCPAGGATGTAPGGATGEGEDVATKIAKLLDFTKSVKPAEPDKKTDSGATSADFAGPARTVSGSWKAYRMDYTTNPPSSATTLVTLGEDGTFEMRSGSSYQGGDLSRMSSAGAGSGTYELRGDALKLRFEDGSELTGSVQGESLSIDGKNYYPCSGFAC